MIAAVERVAISKIEVGIRRRQKVGNVRSLSRSIEAHGLLHPILIRNGKELISGQRRLEACKLLNWSTIPARDVTGCDDEELRAIELDENTERLDLLDYEASKARLGEIRKAQEEAEREAEFRTEGARKPGRPAKPGSERDVATRTGIPPTSQREIEKHVALAEEYPVFKRPEWRQYHVLEAGAKLGVLDEPERHAVAELLDQPGIPPKKAIAMIENLAAMETPHRREILKKAKSDDQLDRRTALTEAATLPPPPDPGLLILDRMARDVKRAESECRIVGSASIIRPLARGIDVAIKKLEKKRSPA